MVRTAARGFRVDFVQLLAVCQILRVGVGCPVVRTIVCYWDDLPEELLDEPGYLELPATSEGMPASPLEGEVVVITVKVSTRVTAVPGRMSKRRGRWAVKVEPRDWDRLGAFAQKLRSPPSSRSPSMVESVRDIRIPSMFPGVPAQTDVMFLRVVLVMVEGEPRSALTRELSASGVVVETRGLAESREQHRDWGDVALVHMPSLEVGLEVVRALRKSNPHLPVVCFGNVPSSSIVAAFSAGADDFIADSTRAIELSAKMMAVVRRKKAREKTPHGPG
jgi:CheY-like chemotaxis protein